ncbi:conserved hypothetical protein [Acinetobacter sp. 8I-beige]|nr:conserved hypothetical protein [Acinetobacter sp. 8I-beige]
MDLRPNVCFLILIGDRKDTKFPDSVRKSQGQKTKPKLMNARTQNRAFAHHFSADKTIEFPVFIQYFNN